MHTRLQKSLLEKDCDFETFINYFVYTKPAMNKQPIHKLDIIVPVINEGDNIAPLTQRIHLAMVNAQIDYRIIFVDDHSTDHTVREINKLTNSFPVILHNKKGKKGKAISILEGAQIAITEYVAMIDGDLQYPPEALPELFEVARKHGIAVANRKNHKTSFLRKFGSKANILIFERILHGFKVDTQSGLKIFKKEIILHLKAEEVGQWSIDMPLLHAGRELGYSIGSINIDFSERINGQSNIKFIHASFEIARHALGLKIKKRKIYEIKGEDEKLPLGSGVAYRGKRFITHTHLPHDKSAFRTFYPWQKIVFFTGLIVVGIGLYFNALTTAIVLTGFLTFIYFLDLLFNLYVLLKSLHFPPELNFNKEELDSLRDDDLPVYSVLCPLYKEARVLPWFVKAINDLDWPKNKLDVLLLLEEDDTETQAAAQALNLPHFFRVLVVPHSQPKTKPKACNWGLAHAKGKYVVVYDAEDKPDTDQLKKSYLAFQHSGEKVACLQSKLNYFNPHQNILTRLFTAEYSLWFDLILPGLQSIDSTIPLGGTSNHFRTEVLKKLHGWDAFNVTEDCDLGTRLFKHGYKTAIIDSTTLEEANSKVKGWIKQRSRWIKGYLQTYLVHTRDPIGFIKTNGIHALVFHLIIGMRMVFILINPLLWLLTISYFALYPYVGVTIEALYPPVVFYPAVTLLVFGNFVYFYNYMIGLAKRGNWSVIKYVFLVPVYWLMTSAAAAVAFKQLFTKPHYWEKTQHGHHLSKPVVATHLADVTMEMAATPNLISEKKPRVLLHPALFGGGILIASSVVANFSNFIYNAFLGREVSLEEFGTVSLMSSIFSLVTVISAAVGRTVNHKSAFLLGKLKSPVKEFVRVVIGKSFIASLAVTVIWVATIPFLARYFQIDSSLPFILFTPIWLVFLPGSVAGGFLMGNFKFIQIALAVVLEASSKLFITYLFVSLNRPELIYTAIPISLILAFIATSLFVYLTKGIDKDKLQKTDLTFPTGFFATSLLTGFASVSFMTLDIILAKHFLTPLEAGRYALLSLSGKMIYFLTGLVSQFLIPVISKNEGESKDSGKAFGLLFLLIASISTVGYVIFGVGAPITIPYLFGDKALSIIDLLPLYGFAMVAFVLSATITTYHQIKNHYLFPVITFSFAIAQVIGITLRHDSITHIVSVITGLSVIQLSAIILVHYFYSKLVSLIYNFVDFGRLFQKLPKTSAPKEKLNILIYNWRDSKHVWGGGAEVYVHEMAKRWVKDGHSVTIFCGNDRKNKGFEKVDGVSVIRRGGFYTVYFWAAVYYIFRFRKTYDCIVDCENGIPFFTPLYSRIPKILLIHHVHQDVFRKHLPFPLSRIAMLIESRLMPLVYRDSKIITVSQSSRDAIAEMNWAEKSDVNIVNPGINKHHKNGYKKTAYPSFLYLGRLQPYKNVDTVIHAFAKILERNRNAKLTIAGFGESIESLKNLSHKYGLHGAVTFTGYVSEEEKHKLLAESWVSLQPSSFEGWGITIIEANQAGTPVIASKISGLIDSVQDNETGILVPVGDIEMWAKTMESLINLDDVRKTLSKNAIVWSKNFSWDKSAKQFLDNIFTIIDPKKAVALSRKFNLLNTK
ncbi:glycosyltransferase [Candidatus Woesebacteria bacterium]|nr:MAG: glycosyltransferase [Candidatus Woesebacteria bacterium]